MLKRKVSAILVLILAVITVVACAFAAVSCIRRNRQMSAPKAKEIGKFRFLNGKSDAEGVRFEVSVRSARMLFWICSGSIIPETPLSSARHMSCID